MIASGEHNTCFDRILFFVFPTFKWDDDGTTVFRFLRISQTMKMERIITKVDNDQSELIEKSFFLITLVVRQGAEFAWCFYLAISQV